MSGGVDSSVTAALLLEQGYQVIGVTMKIWQEEEVLKNSSKSCCSWEAIDDARRIANALDIPHYVLNLSNQFKNTVVDYFIEEYRSAKTPNPCVVCNRQIKFGIFLSKALAIGADLFASGHYVRSGWNPHTRRYFIRKGKDKDKDQSYTLFNLTQKQLSHIVFPLGDYLKEEVRSVAESRGWKVSQKQESQEVCFIPHGDYRDFLRRQGVEFSPGLIKDTAGNIIGTHQGLPGYTLGQRRGLGVSSSVPLYVVAMNPEENTLIVGTREETFSQDLIAHQLNFMEIDPPGKSITAEARIRYRSPEVPAIIYPPDAKGRARVELKRPQPAVTPGQAIVFYRQDRVLGGGTILTPVDRSNNFE